jgi:hypothetical protein
MIEAVVSKLTPHIVPRETGREDFPISRSLR